MKIVVLVMMAALIALSGCQSVLSDPDAAARKALSYACPAMTVAYQGITAYQIAGGKLSAKDQAAVDSAYQAAQDACADPSKAGAATALALVLRETQIIASVLRKNKGA
jgi:uncharacterized protein YceK